mgnify:FL=1|tara:strand:+ start:1394 stop:2377 length:984 start_codon:yes stop_codon:yes gene_type:complete
MISILEYKKYFIKATEYAAIACAQLRGCNDKNKADQAAVNGMRTTLKDSPLDVRVAIGEGEIDEAPMLYIGEKLGTKIKDNKILPLDIAVDPLECTKNCANNAPNAMTVMAVSERNHLFRAPDTYMNKLVVGNLSKDVVSLDYSIHENISNISNEMNKPINKLKAIVLDRDRNQYIVDELNELNVDLEMISDGDVAASLRVAMGEADVYMGIGSAPEGVIAATAVKGLRGYFEGRLHFHTKEARERALLMSDHKIEEKIHMNKLCSSTNSIFVATGVCDGWIPGVYFDGDIATTQSLIIDVGNNKIEKIKNKYSVKDVNKYISKGVK